MAYSIPALLRPTLEILRALLSPARGRHSAAAARRRRSTRVRRYAPMPAPEQAAAPASRPAPRLTPPPAPVPADDVALVRPYYTAHERDLSRAQHGAAARLRSWGASPDPIPAPRTIPEGDLLAPDHPSFTARNRTAVAV
ncbi:hypothetical protein KIK06_20220 [Nocardiopsis sp. EMB25]|uniref:hypothetical protein n=1 Tax=Nocardiopsis sp. EMB25 TaxID=2835867 RepID=UPI0022842C6C|nr:hypothetical protein [Nocardiopsis sp. EMB25]MCY9786223.1 hypothetical protein [Nocardiopsis sp. EMB25]